MTARIHRGPEPSGHPNPSDTINATQTFIAAAVPRRSSGPSAQALPTTADGQPVTSPAQVGIAANWTGKSVAILVPRGDLKLYVPLRLS